MNFKKILIIFLFSLLIGQTAEAQSSFIDPDFNPGRIIEDNQMLNYNSMTLGEIQAFLENKNSYLANYRTENAYGVVKSAAEIIYDAANQNYDISFNYKTNQYECDHGLVLGTTLVESEIKQKCQPITTVNPLFLLILLQKESSLIENSKPTQNHLDWATGYMIFDGMITCSPYDKCWRYKGFGKQVNSAALQFLYYLKTPGKYTYEAGKTYTFSNQYGTIFKEGMTVYIENNATAALYNYTPHVFNGNYNVFKLLKRYTTEKEENIIKIIKAYPDGSLIKLANDPGIWLIEKGQKRPFLNYSAFISRFKPDQIVIVSEAEFSKYEVGPNIKFANYSIVQTPDEQIYLLVDKEKRPFASLAVFKKIGFNPEEIEKASVEDLTLYTVGKTITATSTYVTGALLQDTKTGGVYYVIDGTKAPLTDRILLTTKFKDKKIIKATPEELEKYTKVAPVLLDDGTLVKTDNYPTVYLISNGLKRPFADENIFASLGYNFNNVITVSSQFLYNYQLGGPIQKTE